MSCEQVSVRYDQIYYKSQTANSALSITDSLEVKDLKRKSSKYFYVRLRDWPELCSPIY